MQPMMIDAVPSSHGASSWWLRKTPDERHRQAQQRRRVLEEDGEQARVLAVMDGGDGTAPAPRRPAERAPGDAEREALEDRREGEHHVVDGRALERRRVLDVGDALVDGHAAADAEDAHGDDEAPEVDLHAVPERVVLVGGPGAPVEAVEEQSAVAGVDHGVDALADHRRAAGDGAGDELDHRDGEVADDRGDDSLLGLLCHGRSVLHARRTGYLPDLQTGTNRV